jgi:ribonucleoside-triphosphate reductase
MNEEIKRIDEKITETEQKRDDPKLCEGTATAYSRVSGYYRAVKNWNAGKKSEFKQRKEYQL